MIKALFLNGQFWQARGNIQFGLSAKPKISSCPAPGLLGSFQLLLGILKAQFGWYLLWKAVPGVRSQPSSLAEMECGRRIPTVENTSRNLYNSVYFYFLRIQARNSVFMDSAHTAYNQLENARSSLEKLGHYLNFEFNLKGFEGNQEQWGAESHTILGSLNKKNMVGVIFSIRTLLRMTYHTTGLVYLKILFIE